MTVRVLGRALAVAAVLVAAGAGLTGSAQAAAGQSGQIQGNGGKCLDVPGGTTTNGTQVQIYTCNHTNAQVWTAPQEPSDPSTLQQQVIDLVNNYRAQNGKPPLEPDPALTRTAQDEADAEAAHGQEGHYTFDHIFDSLQAYGYSHPMGAVAENAAGAPGFWTDAQSVVQAWIDEPTHRAYMLGDFTYTGVGLTVDNGTYWWAQDFAG